MTTCTPVSQRANPIRAGDAIDAIAFRDIRQRMVLDGCKWDPQVGDVATLAAFPLMISRNAWRQIEQLAEQLASELLAAEQEIRLRPELLRLLGLPRRLDSAVRESCAHPPAARIMRFDFHWTTNGWQISEVNSDVPGGFAESGLFAQLMAEATSVGQTTGDAGRAWCAALAREAAGKPVAFLAAAGFMEDQQVVSYLAGQLRAMDLEAFLVQADQLERRDDIATFRGHALGAIVRFYQAEWLATCRTAPFLRHLTSSRTPISNPLAAIIGESKRLPLTWDHLHTPLPRWRSLLPETREVRAAPWSTSDEWLLKTALCNTGDTVSIRELLTPRQWQSVRRDVWLRPRNWIAQRRFETTPVSTPLGSLFRVSVCTSSRVARPAHTRGFRAGQWWISRPSMQLCLWMTCGRARSDERHDVRRVGARSLNLDAVGETGAVCAHGAVDSAGSSAGAVGHARLQFRSTARRPSDRRRSAR
jgi:glutathionylspermidine synthase